VRLVVAEGEMAGLGERRGRRHGEGEAEQEAAHQRPNAHCGHWSSSPVVIVRQWHFSHGRDFAFERIFIP
jgi:hypothetical protein